MELMEVGTRVRAVRDLGVIAEQYYVPAGTHGTIVRLIGMTFPYDVQFDNQNNGQEPWPVAKNEVEEVKE
jgi:hypothetical protein